MKVYNCVFLFTGVAGWSSPSHEIVARLAEHYLTPEGKSFVANALGSDVADLAETMAIVSSWADGPGRTEIPISETWHFFGAPEDFDSFQGSMCTASEGQLMCALAAQIQALLSPVVDEREQAMKFVIHLMADIHQPLHVGRLADRNANAIKTAVPEELRMKLNAKGWGTLHTMWDMLIPEYLFQVDPDASVPATTNIAAPKHVRFPQYSPEEMADDLRLRVVNQDVHKLPLDETSVQDLNGLINLFGQMAVDLHRDYSLPFAYQFVADEATGAMGKITADKKLHALPKSYVVDNASRVPLLLTQSAVRLAQVLNLMAKVDAASRAVAATTTPPLDIDLVLGIVA